MPNILYHSNVMGGTRGWQVLLVFIACDSIWNILGYLTVAQTKQPILSQIYVHKMSFDDIFMDQTITEKIIG